MITVVGESLVDFVPRPDGGIAAVPGGSPANVARGLARLGHPVLLRTVLGDDDDGRLIAESLRADGVQIDPASVRDVSTSTATAHLDAEGRATYDLDVHWAPGSIALHPDATWLHTGSLAVVLDPGRHDVLTLLGDAASSWLPVSVDLNLRDPLPWDAAHTLAQMDALAPHASVVKASDDDLALLRPGEDPRQVARRWFDGGRTALVVVTLGGRGAWAATRSIDVEVAAPRVSVVDTVGAGDTFMAALVAGLVEEGLDEVGEGGRMRSLEDVDTATLESVLWRAAVAAAMCCEREGADPPTVDELAARLG